MGVSGEERKDLLTPLTITPSTFSHIDPLASYLLFDSLPPDSLQVYCWHDEQGDVYVEHIEVEKIDAKDVDSEAVSGFQIHLSEGSYIYEAVAQWGDGTQQGGKISYCFAANMLMPVLQGIG